MRDLVEAGAVGIDRVEVREFRLRHEHREGDAMSLGQRDRSRRCDERVPGEIDSPGAAAGRACEPAGAADDRLRDIQEQGSVRPCRRQVSGRDHADDALVNRKRAAVVERDCADLAVGTACVEGDALVGDVAEFADRGAPARAARDRAANLNERRMVRLCLGRRGSGEHEHHRERGQRERQAQQLILFSSLRGFRSYGVTGCVPQSALPSSISGVFVSWKRPVPSALTV